MKGSPIFWSGEQLGPHNVNKIAPGGWSMGWYAFYDLEPDDEQGARNLLSAGLKAQLDYFPGVPWRVFSKPRLLGVLLDSGFDVDLFFDHAFTHGYVFKVRDMHLYSLRLLFEHGAKMPDLDKYPQTHETIIETTWTKEKILQPIFDAVQMRRNRCRAAVLALYGVRRIRRAERDVFGMVMRMVWATRRQDIWNPEKNERRQGR